MRVTVGSQKMTSSKQHSIDISVAPAAAVHHVFYYNADNASVASVALLGSFNDWNRDGAVQMTVTKYYLFTFLFLCFVVFDFLIF
jgi:hypothetical protein